MFVCFLPTWFKTRIVKCTVCFTILLSRANKEFLKNPKQDLHINFKNSAVSSLVTHINVKICTMFSATIFSLKPEMLKLGRCHICIDTLLAIMAKYGGSISQ